MLHPHVPEGLKHFGKHLFATFLGLLMALALESCYQEHEQAKRAHAAMVAVKAEVESNRKDVARSKDSVQKTIGDWKRVLQEAEAILQGKTHEEKTRAVLSLDLPTLPSAAWDAAVASQAVHHIPFNQIQALSNLYKEQRFMDDLKRPLMEDMQQIYITCLVLEGKNSLRNMSRSQLREFIAAMRPFLFHLEVMRQVLQETMISMEDALKLLR